MYDDEFDDYETGDDDSETVPCPSCGRDIFEDAERCPWCGDYVVADTSALSGRPSWWIVLGLLGVAAVIAALSGFLF